MGKNLLHNLWRKSRIRSIIGRYFMVTLISKDKKQFKGNLHCHSTLSDGNLTPEELKEAYKARGYQVLAITDHEYPKHHQDLAEEDFVMLTGWEAYIRPGADGKYNAYNQEVHMNLFARDPENVGYVCYDPKYCRYMKPEIKELIQPVGPVGERDYSVEYINHFVATAKDNGYIVSYNHPYWSMDEEIRIMQYEGFFNLELYNYSSYKGNHLEINEPLYDRMLANGIRMGCHGSDDNHNPIPFHHPANDSFGSYAMILADELSYDSVFHALENQECYASCGPRIYELTVTEGRYVHIECSPASSIFVHWGSKAPAAIYAEEGQLLTSVDVKLPKQATFFRVNVYDEKDRPASTRGYFRDEWTK